MGREVLIYAPNLALGDLRTPSHLDGARVIAVPSLGLPLVPPESRLGFPYLRLGELWRFQPDLVHLFSPAAGLDRRALRALSPRAAHRQLPDRSARLHTPLWAGLPGRGPAWAYVRHLHSKATLT
ncbi:MAG: hypothetical protein M5U29_01125 [Anaerolineae bacterium]|nr:hypothetical protein [Anaerolineae bacterium]